MSLDGTSESKAVDDRLRDLLLLLRERGYSFVTPTPATHARVIARPEWQEATTIEGILGWSLPYRPGACDPAVEALLDEADAVRHEGTYRRATVRVSRLHEDLFLHSAYPTDDEHSVFFGPDSYRFADLVRAELREYPARPGALVVDIGTGSGVGGIIASRACPGLHVHLTDVNPEALRLARINTLAGGIEAAVHESKTLDAIHGPVDVAMANPPYIIDRDGRLYRDGGAMHGGQVSLNMAVMAMQRLAPAGRMILYTGSAIVRGHDALKAALLTASHDHGCTMRYREIDPDVFGEELDGPAYRDVDRIALVAIVLTRL